MLSDSAIAQRVKKYPIETPSRDQQFRNAIQILETYYMVTNNLESSFNWYPNDEPRYIKVSQQAIAGTIRDYPPGTNPTKTGTP